MTSSTLDLKNKLNTVKRETSVLFQDSQLKEFCSFKEFPIYMGSDEEEYSQDLFVDMKWGYCEKSGLVQLMELIPLDLLYSKHHNPGVTGKTWEDHHFQLSNLIKKKGFNNVLEIGGATGTLFNYFIKSNDRFFWNVLEPSGVCKITDDRISVVIDYFENYNPNNVSYDVIVHSHVLEHVYDPITFLNKSWDLLDEGGYQYISIPNMKEWLERGYTNTLMFEHTYYIDEKVLEYLLNKTGFVIEDKVVNHHSIMVRSKKVNKKINPEDYDFEYSKKLFERYYNNLIDDVKKIVEQVGNDKVYLFGAHIFAQIYLNLGLNEDNIISILDNNTEKQGRRLYGTNLIINSPKVLGDCVDPTVIIRAGSYTNEIVCGIMKINKDTIFY